MILACHNIKKSYGVTEINKGGSFHIEEYDKLAIVGNNGAGKSTLLKIIMNEISSDAGEVIVAKGKTLGYLSQHQELNSDNTIYEEVLDVKRYVIELENKLRDLEIEMKLCEGKELEDKLALYSRLNHEFEEQNGYAYKSEVTGVLKGLGFSESDFEKRVSTLSGGQKTRVSLGKLLITKPDIILLDEPINHLDLNSISWLETYLVNYSGTVVIVAHDRYFLDKIVNKVVDVENGTFKLYEGTYTEFAQKKEQLRDVRVKQFINQQKEIKHQEEVITKLRSFNREKSIKRAESREKMLDKMEIIDKPVEVNGKMNLKLEPPVVSGKDVLSLKNISKSFPDKTLFSNINFEIKRGERVALIGDNGTGKTTLFKIINGTLPADSGEYKIGAKVSIGYYDQEHQELDMENNIFDEISDAYPNLTNTQIRNVLAAFLFSNEDVFKQIKDLSGGERGRVSLAKLMLSESNFLLLDEPTNHLDMESKEILENAINMYTGTILFISHDRYFINKTATRILDLNSQTIINYLGNYDYYLEKKDVLSVGIANEKKEILEDENISETKLDWKKQKEEQAKERKIKNQILKIEQKIQDNEARQEEIDGLLVKEEVFSDLSKVMELHKEREIIEEKLLELYAEWEEIVS